MYDSQSILIPTALRSLWLLYKRGRWEQLRQLGVRRAEVEKGLRYFDDHRVGATPNLTSKQIVEFLQVSPKLLEGAVRMVGVYMILYTEAIQYEYGGKNETLPQQRD